MGLLKAAAGAVNSVLADQWKEYFVCEALDVDTLVAKGQKHTSRRSSNTRGSDNVISDGSGIVVADGQCMIIVEQGKIVEVCAEPGQFTYRTDLEPSIFTGSLGDGIRKTFDEIGKRFAYGGQAAKDQRVYYFNTKEIVDNKFGTPTPVPFRIVDKNIGLDIDVSVRCNGVYSYRLKDPLLFYTNVCGNVSSTYERSEIDRQLKSEFISGLQPSFAKLSAMEIRPYELTGHVDELCQAMNQSLTNKWAQLRGLEVVSIAINSITLPEEDQELIKQLQKAAINRDPNMAAAQLAGAQADAMREAAKNPNGAMTGFMGMNMAAQTGGMNAAGLYQTAQSTQSAADTWTCSCGAENTGNFCAQCGNPKPAPVQGWTCSCGAINQGRFCTECGKPKPAGLPLYRCDKCGWQPDDPQNPPKFCPECGDPFDDGDIVENK